MSWKNNLLPASFGSASFMVEDHTLSGGRHGVHHVYPGRDNGYVEDLGRKDRKFSFNAYVLGPDYMTARDILINALEKPGADQLVHPYLGTFRVAVDPDAGYSSTESTREGGICRFTLNFIRSDIDQYPAVSTDSAAAVSDAAASVLARGASDFALDFNTRTTPGFVRESAISNVKLLAETLHALSASRWITDGSAYVNAVSRLEGDAGSLVADPAGLATNVQGVFSMPNNPNAAMRTLGALVGFEDQIPAVTNASATPSRQREAVNSAAFGRLISQSAAAVLATSVAGAEFDSFDAAMAALETTTEILDTEIGKAADSGADPMYQSLESLRAELVSHVRSTSGDLARVITVSTRLTRPALVVAYELYEDIDRADQITRRNGVANPNLLPGGADLEILNA